MTAADRAKAFISKVSKKVGEVINGACTAVWKVGKNLFDRFINVVKVKSGSPSISSYVLTTYSSDDVHDGLSISSIGDEMTGEAISLGEPYIVFVTESDGKTTVDDFSDSPVEISIEYTDKMLSDIGATEENESEIEMFKYDEKKCGYFSVGGDVDTANNKVTVTITEPGQFILAINKITTPDNNDPAAISDNSVEKQTLAQVSSKTFTAGSDTYTVSWNSFVQFDGRKHNGVGTDASGNPASSKESGKKVSDLKVIITKNGEPVDPSKYTVKTKNNKNASVSIDGITAIQTNSKKLPSFTIKFKGKEYKDANKAAKNERFEFGIIPAELKDNLVTFDKVKTGKDGTVQIKQVTFKPEAGTSGGPAPKPLKLKYKKPEAKTDFVTDVGSDGSMTITGKNNYYGTVAYKK